MILKGKKNKLKKIPVPQDFIFRSLFFYNPTIKKKKTSGGDYAKRPYCC
jgi:hypothetical protein